MAKKALSVTIDPQNVLWLKGRARIAGSTLSETLDKVITQARTGRNVLGRPPSVVGMVDLSDDPDLSKADMAIRQMFEESHARFLEFRDEPPRVKGPRKKKPRG